MRLRVLLSALAVVAATLVGSAVGAASDLPVSYNFLGSAVSAGAHVNADPPGANDWTCRPTAAHPRPVVLVHGTAGNKNTNWQTYAPLLANNGYCVYALTYGVAPGTPPVLDQLGGLGDIRASAQQLKDFVARVLASTGADKVDLVGHSQGTLMPNYWIKFMGGAPYVDKYISLAPLWHGTNMTPVLPLLAKVFGVAGSPLPLCAACPQMAAGSSFMNQMRSGRVAVEGVSYTNIMTSHDELVRPYTSGREEGMTNIVLQDACALDRTEHFEIASDPIAAAYVLNTLDPAHPRPVPCKTVLPFIGPIS